MTHLPSTSEIADVKHLVLRRGGSIDDLWQRWAMKVTPASALKELLKLASMPHREGSDYDEKLRYATYVDALVEERVPFFALGSAINCFLRGHVPDQSEFYPTIAELLAECRRQFIAMVKIDPSYERTTVDQRSGPYGGRHFEELPKWMQDRILDNRAAFEEYRKEHPRAVYSDFLRDCVKAAGSQAAKLAPGPRSEALQMIAEAARKRDEEHRIASLKRRLNRGIGEPANDDGVSDVERLMRSMDERREALDG